MIVFLVDDSHLTRWGNVHHRPWQSCAGCSSCVLSMPGAAGVITKSTIRNGTTHTALAGRIQVFVRPPLDFCELCNPRGRSTVAADTQLQFALSHEPHPLDNVVVVFLGGISTCVTTCCLIRGADSSQGLHTAQLCLLLCSRVCSTTAVSSTLSVQTVPVSRLAGLL